MARGRQANVAKVISRTAGSADAKARLNAILATMAGKQSVAQACRLLGVGERRFHKLRNEFLNDAILWCEPRGPGRPPHASTPRSDNERRVEELEAALRDLRIDLRASRIREEIALVVPHVVRRWARTKKGASTKRLVSRRTESAAGSERSSQRASANDA